MAEEVKYTEETYSIPRLERTHSDASWNVHW